MYKGLILRAFLFDVILPLAFLIYLLARGVRIFQGKEPLTLEAKSTLLVGILIVVVFFLTDALPRVEDYVFYLARGDNYVQEVTCTVANVGHDTLTSMLFGNETLWCTDDVAFYILYQRTYQQWRKEGRTFRIYYLPRSRFVVRLEKVK